MEAKAKLNFLRIAPRKVRLTVDLIRGKKIEEAREALSFTVKKSSDPVLKLLNSAVANAVNNLGMEEDNLYVSEIKVDEGPKYKRWRPRARGQANLIQKKTSHITLVLSEIKAKKKKAVKKEKPEVKRVTEKPAEKFSEKEKPDSQKPKKEIKSKGRAKGIKNMFRRKSF